ncbi:hypothetical protein [Methylobacterium nigriterrae]|uniref:hypothetical protein n=1 Tax=Methylobacterium nigriterrae TaxID=3127512 RepID=UPI0030134E71
MAENLTVTSLLARGLISNADIAAAVTAYLSAPETTAYPLGDQFALDLCTAVAAHPFTVKTLKHGQAGVSARRAAVRTALMLARPEKR